MSKKSNLSAVVEAKSEYTKLLLTYLKPPIYEALVVIYSSSVENAVDVHSITGAFHRELSNITKWNNEVIRNETDRLQEGCPFLDELITAVILANVKILTSIRTKKTKKQLKITVPTAGNFVHSIYINVGKEILNNPDSFDIELYNGDITRNYGLVGSLIESSIETAIRSAIPLRHILDTSLPKTDDQTESDSDNEHEHIPEPEFSDECIDVPVMGEPEMGEPEMGEPEMGEPEMGEPEMGEPEMSVPETGVPETGVPEMGYETEPTPTTVPAGNQTMMGGILSHSDEDEEEDDVKEVSIHEARRSKQSFFDN